MDSMVIMYVENSLILSDSKRIKEKYDSEKILFENIIWKSFQNNIQLFLGESFFIQVHLIESWYLWAFVFFLEESWIFKLIKRQQIKQVMRLWDKLLKKQSHSEDIIVLLLKKKFWVQIQIIGGKNRMWKDSGRKMANGVIRNPTSAELREYKIKMLS